MNDLFHQPPFYNTTHESGATLVQFAAVAKEQNAQVLAMMKALKLASPSQVLAHLRSGAPITSIRRAMNTLTAEGKLRKTTDKVKGPYGRPECLWEYIEQP